MSNIVWLDPDVDEPLEPGHVETMDELRPYGKRIMDVITDPERRVEIIADMIAAAPCYTKPMPHRRSHTGVAYQVLSIPNHGKFLQHTGVVCVRARKTPVK